MDLTLSKDISRNVHQQCLKLAKEFMITCVKTKIDDVLLKIKNHINEYTSAPDTIYVVVWNYLHDPDFDRYIKVNIDTLKCTKLHTIVCNNNEVVFLEQNLWHMKDPDGFCVNNELMVYARTLNCEFQINHDDDGDVHRVTDVAILYANTHNLSKRYVFAGEANVHNGQFLEIRTACLGARQSEVEFGLKP